MGNLRIIAREGTFYGFHMASSTTETQDKIGTLSPLSRTRVQT